MPPHSSNGKRSAARRSKPNRTSQARPAARPSRGTDRRTWPSAFSNGASAAEGSCGNGQLAWCHMVRSAVWCAAATQWAPSVTCPLAVMQSGSSPAIAAAIRLLPLPEASMRLRLSPSGTARETSVTIAWPLWRMPRRSNFSPLTWPCPLGRRRRKRTAPGRPPAPHRSVWPTRWR
jgi:hypothetical protein